MLKNNVLLRKFISIFLAFNLIFICMNISSCSKHNYEYYPELIEYINSSIPKDSDMEIVYSKRDEYSEKFKVEIWVNNIINLNEISLLFDLYNSYIDNNPDYIESNVMFDFKAKDTSHHFAYAYANNGGYVDTLEIGDFYGVVNIELSDFEGLFPTITRLNVRDIGWDDISEFDAVASMPNIQVLTLVPLSTDEEFVEETTSELSERYPNLLVIIQYSDDKTYYSNPTLAEDYGYDIE